MLRPGDTPEMKSWNDLVSLHKDHWDYYKKLLNYSMQKSANSFWTKHLYPSFYQERILKRVFVENMRLLGDFTDDEIHQFESSVSILFMKNLYNYYRVPEGGWMNIYSVATLGVGLIVSRECYMAKRPKKWWVLAPIAIMAGITAVTQRFLMIQFGMLVSMSEWALEKRKAEVWAAQGLIQVPPLLPLPYLRDDLAHVVVEQLENDLISSVED